jgi:hypothetical protein
MSFDIDEVVTEKAAGNTTIEELRQEIAYQIELEAKVAQIELDLKHTKKALRSVQEGQG